MKEAERIRGFQASREEIQIHTAVNQLLLQEFGVAVSERIPKFRIASDFHVVRLLNIDKLISRLPEIRVAYCISQPCFRIQNRADRS